MTGRNSNNGILMNRDSQRVLIVDNDPVFLKLASDFLSRAGHEVTCTENGSHCLDLLRDYVPDVIFIDLIMPEMGGDDLCRAIRNHDHLKEVYVVIVSAVAKEQDIDISCGANSCIAKGPFREMRLLLRKAMDAALSPIRQQHQGRVEGTGQLYPRRITRELLQRNHHVKLILENMSQGIIELSANRVVYMNRSGGEMLGVSFDEVVGMEAEQVFPSSLYNFLGTVSGAGAEGDDESPPATMRLYDRQLVVEELALDNTSHNRIIMLSDITESKKMEAVIEAANLTENLGYVFSGIRHEIGNPVNSIKMALSVLQRNLVEYDHDTVAEFLDRTLQEVSRIEYLLKALKNYSLFEKPVVETISLASFLKDFIALSKNDLEQKNIRFRSIITDENLLVRADSRALHHVLLNLLTNAVDSLERHDSPEIIISCTSRGKKVEVKVDDNGKGIPESDQQNLFKPFFTSKTYGTGLGLVIVKKMLVAMHGTIQVESYEGLGTTVTITLPGRAHEPR